MTPMIDVTFLLLIFFMLAGHFASAEKVEIDLPRPNQNQGVERRLKDKVIINVERHDATGELELRLGPMRLGSLGELGERLGQVAEENPQTQVILRAHRRLRYGDVRRVMEIVAAQKLTRLQIVTELD